jgi:acetoin utilization protein AcuB
MRDAPRRRMMPTVDVFMTLAPYCVSSTDNLKRARQLMDDHAIRHQPVVDGNELVGLLLDRELAVIEAIPGVQPTSIAVSPAMRPALSVSENMPLDEALDLMIEHHLDCLVVRRSGLVEGVFTAVDALEAVSLLSRASVGAAHANHVTR